MRMHDAGSSCSLAVGVRGRLDHALVFGQLSLEQEGILPDEGLVVLLGVGR